MMAKADKETLLIAGPAGDVEVRLTEPGDGALRQSGLLVVLCHPNPSQGGTMDNKVVTTLMRVYRDLGVRVVSFNFRGVGRSQGVFDQGRGELDDLRAVIAWVREHYPDTRLMLAGFSFGSAMAAQASHEQPDLQHLLLVAPPVERYTYDREGRFPCPVSVVIGDQDELVDVAGVLAWTASLTPSPHVISYAGVGHFFHGHLAQLKTDLGEHLANVPGLG